MVISTFHRFIFIHVYKVAGTAITRYFQDRRIGQSQMFGDMPIHAHTPARELREMLPGDVFSGYFKFAVVRNPWDFECSMYHFVKKTTDHRHHELVTRLGSFGRYLKYKYYMHLEQESQGAGSPLGVQQKFVCDLDGTLLADYVARFESIQDDFREIRRRIGLDPSDDLPRSNASNHRDYRQYYDEAGRDYVAAFHRKDIDYFGYAFDAPASADVAA